MKATIIFSALTLLTVFSCKKKTEEPSPKTQTPATYSYVTFGVAIVDVVPTGTATGSFASTYSASVSPNISASVVEGFTQEQIDVVNNFSTTTLSLQSEPYYCNGSATTSYSVTVNTKTFKIKDGGSNLVNFYNNGTFIGAAHIAQVSPLNIGWMTNTPGISSVCNNTLYVLSY